MSRVQYRFGTGDVIKVRKAEDIEQELDDLDRFDGCLFMSQMRGCCEQEFKVAKQVKHLFDEKKMKIYKTKMPLYILENVICDGRIEGLGYICDHSCHIIWHERWLQNGKNRG
jgi:hypothetical protein